MQRGLQGTYSTTKFAGETVRAFEPSPLPPDPALVWTEKLQEKFDRAHIQMGRLDSLSTLLPDPDLFIYMYVRKEALLSSMIEGTKSSLSELLLFELDNTVNVEINDVQEVSNYVSALNLGLQLLSEGWPISNRLIRTLHAELLRQGRGSDKLPGEFRTSQNWIGASRPGNAEYVPPPATSVMEHMSNLEKFINDIPSRTPPLLKAALTHVQFETIHPFLDGNGRVGRMLVPLILVNEGILQQPILYISLYLKANRNRYYELLQNNRLKGNWEEWLDFFADAVIFTSEKAVESAQRTVGLNQEYMELLEQQKRGSEANRRALDLAFKRPIATVNSLSSSLGYSKPAMNSLVQEFERLGIFKEISGKSRNRIFSNWRFFEILDEGTELPD